MGTRAKARDSILPATFRLRARAKNNLAECGSGGSDQCSILNSHPKGEAAACVRSYLALVEHFAIRHPLRMRIEHWELSIGQIPGRIHGSGFCQVVVAGF